MRRLPLLPEAPRPLLFAHRGLSALAPENTMAAFRLARENGIPGLELDVHLSVDGRIVVVHDHFTDRVAPGQGKGDLGLEVERSTLAALRALDIGSWHSPGFAGERISLLTDVFEELGDSVYYDIEIKNRGAADYGLEAALATVLRDSAPTGRYFVSSFNPISLARFKTLSPEIATAIIWCESEELPWYLRRGAGRIPRARRQRDRQGPAREPALNP
jgi:glycerophosphoryl diester phosphodiesterase